MSLAALEEPAHVIDLFAPGLDRLLVNLSLFLVFLTTTLFFSAQSGERCLLLRPAVQASALLTAATGTTACWIASSVGIPDYPNFLGENSRGLTPVYLFYLTGNAYFLYCCAVLAWSGYRAAKRPAIQLRWAFYLASASSLAMLVGGPVPRIASLVVARLGGFTVTEGLQHAEQLLLRTGIIGFLGSLCAFAARTFLAMQRQLRLMRQKIDCLTPLWEALSAAIPGVEFKRQGVLEGIADAILRDMRFRYDKVSNECEYGLWLVGEYVQVSVEPMTLKRQAEAVYEALVRIHEGTATATEPVPIARSPEGDDRPLLVFAAEFAKIVERNGPPQGSAIDERA